MPFTFTSTTPSTLGELGGYQLDINGTFELGHRYHVHIGDIGTTVDPICHSGKAGQGSVVYPFTENILRVYSPSLKVSSSPYWVAILDLDTLEALAVPDLVTVVPQQYYSSVYAIRKPLPPNYNTGPRNIENEPPTG